MNITVINGSPKTNGTCSNIINEIIENISNKNRISKYELNNMNIHGCQECFACRTSKTDTCFFHDDLTAVLEEVKSTEMLIIASPVFYSDVSAQLKCFIDRTWSYYGINGRTASHLPKNRKIIIVLSFGYTNKDRYTDLIKKYESYFTMFGFTQSECIIAYGAQYFNGVPLNQDEISQKIKQIHSICYK